MQARWWLSALVATLTGLALAQPVRRQLLVSTEWLDAHRNDPTVVVHVTRDARTYEAGHIPGARLLLWDQFTVARDGIPVELPPAEELKARFEALGVGDRTRVVLYGDNLGLAAARAWFTLDFLGHGEQAALLDGGLEKWRAESRTLSQETPQVKPRPLAVRLRPQAVATLEQMRRFAENPPANILLADARPRAEYLGEKPSGNPTRVGHIPGAVHLYWMDALVSRDRPTLRPAADLRAWFAAAGFRPGKTVVTYCVAGVQAAFLYYVARYLGYEAALYDGSLAEWNRLDGTPLIVGPMPR